jgi:hypothetical protein
MVAGIIYCCECEYRRQKLFGKAGNFVRAETESDRITGREHAK